MNRMISLQCLIILLQSFISNLLNPFYEEERFRNSEKNLERWRQSDCRVSVGFFIGSCGNDFERAQSQMSYITLSVLIAERAEVVDKSNQNNRNPRVPLSLTAGGMGLNLVCNHILLFNLCWDHQLESQSHKRIYRVGQEKQERIYIFTIIFWDYCRENEIVFKHHDFT